MLDVPIEPVVLSQDMFHLRNGAKQRLARKLVGRLCLTRWLLLSCSSLPHKRWLSAAEGGLMASGYAFGYMLAVPVLTTLTDRIDVRLVLLCGSILSGLATWAIWSIAGLGFAGAPQGNALSASSRSRKR
jgi:MFS family permease